MVISSILGILSSLILVVFVIVSIIITQRSPKLFLDKIKRKYAKRKKNSSIKKRKNNNSIKRRRRRRRKRKKKEEEDEWIEFETNFDIELGRKGNNSISDSDDSDYSNDSDDSDYSNDSDYERDVEWDENDENDEFAKSRLINLEETIKEKIDRRLLLEPFLDLLTNGVSVQIIYKNILISSILKVNNIYLQWENDDNDEINPNENNIQIKESISLDSIVKVDFGKQHKTLKKNKRLKDEKCLTLYFQNDSILNLYLSSLLERDALGEGFRQISLSCMPEVDF